MSPTHKSSLMPSFVFAGEFWTLFLCFRLLQFVEVFDFFFGFPLITEKGGGGGGGLYTGYFNDPIVVVYCTAGSAREEVGANPVGHPLWQDRSVLPPREY